MRRDRISVWLTLGLLGLVLVCAFTQHWRTLFAVLLLALIVLITVAVYSALTKDIPDDDALALIRNGLWKRSIGASFPNWPDKPGTVREPDPKLPEAERLVAYVDRALDRQINKARGLLPFNSLLMAIMAFEKNRMTGPIQWDDSYSDLTAMAIFAVILGLLLSNLYCLELFWVHWGRAEMYGDFAAEFGSGTATLRKRSRILAKSIILSGVSTLGAIAILLWGGLTGL